MKAVRYVEFTGSINWLVFWVIALLPVAVLYFVLADPTDARAMTPSWVPFEWAHPILLAILLNLTTFGELALFCIFLRSVALNLKDEKLQEPVEPLVRLALSIVFILVCFHLLVNTGTTEVLINILWVVYLFASSFYVWFLIWYMMTLFFARARIAKQIRIYGGDELAVGEDDDEEDEDDDEEDEEEFSLHGCCTVALTRPIDSARSMRATPCLYSA